MKKVKDYQKNKEQEKLRKKNQIYQKHHYLKIINLRIVILKKLNIFKFFTRFSKKNKEKKEKTLKNNSSLEIEMNLPNELKLNNLNEPNYGCLKNGIKPTFNQLNKTQKNLQTEKIKIVLNNTINNNEKKQ